jgi:hypothetical protein
LGTKEAWFAGLIDGEGCFTIGVSLQHKRALKFSLIFSISMKNGDWQDVAQDLLKFHEIPFHTRRRRNQFEITVSGHKSVKKLIDMAKPYLVVKKPVAEVLAGFPVAPSRNRFSQVDKHYLEIVCEKVDQVRFLNKGKNRKHKWDGRRIWMFYDE